MKKTLKKEDQKKIQSNILVHGAGSWGTALAMQLAYNGNKVFLHSWEKDHNERMISSDRNYDYFPSIPFPESLKVVADWKTVVDNCSDILIASPSKGFSEVLLQLKPHIENKGIVVATKGFCNSNNDLVHQVVSDITPINDFAIITGPSFAKEVATQLPTSVIVASVSVNYAQHVKSLFGSKFFRCYISNDLVGCEIGGAIKNVLAIACGISDGLGFGTNARSTIITQGLAELTSLGQRLGGKIETFSGLSGIGDMILTCSDNKSRNRQLGFLLGEGKTRSEAINIVEQMVEGIPAAKAIFELAEHNRVNMPIVRTVYEILYLNSPVRIAVEKLLSR